MVLSLPVGGLGRRVGLRRCAEATPVAHHPAGAVGLICLVCPLLGPPVLGQSPPAGLKPLGAIARHRLGALGPLALELLFGLAKPGAAPVRGAKPLGQLIASGLAVDLILGGVDATRLGEDLGGDLLVGADRAIGGRGGELGAVDREHADVDDPGLAAEPQHLAEEVGQRLFVANAKARDRRVVGGLVGADHPEGDVLSAAALDPAR